MGESVFLADLPALDAKWKDAELAARWEKILGVREIALKALEEARAAKKIGKSQQAKVSLRGAAVGGSPVAWVDILQVAEVEDISAAGAVKAEVAAAAGAKCPRCWRYRTDIGAAKQHPDLCARCAQVLG
jgi:isoleucyl-tRNA synthetase